MSRRCRKFMRQIHKATTRYSLQEIASSIQSELDRRNLSYEEALNLGNILQDRADTLPGDEIVYAVSDRDSYRRTLELYLKDGVLTQAEQLLLWEERSALGSPTRCIINLWSNSLLFGQGKASRCKFMRSREA